MATSFEKKLDKDFWSYLTLAKDLYDNFSADEESKNLCEAWLCRLSGKSFLTVDGKRDRNIYLSRLLLQIQNGKLSGIFLEVPPDGPLKSAFSVFGLPAELEELREIDEKGFRIDPNTVGVSDDLFEVSRDGRTYLATRRIPNGLMAYLAVTVTDGEPLWVDQSNSNVSKMPSSSKTCQSEAGKSMGRFVKRLAQFECTPLTQLRKSPQEREKLLEWMDRIIEGCNRWLRDEDPKNKDLETLFELLYQDYQNDPQKAKILEMKRGVRDILMKDIRNRVGKRRDEIAKRELILDQYEADEYKEERLSARRLDEIWLECAKKPMKSSVERVLKCIYPHRVIERFFELLIQERIGIIEKREKDAELEICNLKNDSLNRVNEELLKLQKVQNGYKELYCLYKKVENYAEDARKRAQERGLKYNGDESLRKEEIQEMKKRIEAETEEKRAIYEDFRAVQNNLSMKLKGLKENYACMKEKINRREALYHCEEKRFIKEKEKIKEAMRSEKKKLHELRTLVKVKEGEKC